MNFNIKHNGSSINPYVISCDTEHRICSGIGTAHIVLRGDYPSQISTWDTIEVYISGRNFTFFVSNINHNLPEGTISVDAQDITRRLTDYFITDFYTITSPYTVGYWLRKFLEEAGISKYSISSIADATLLSNNTQLGLSNAYEAIVSLIQMAGLVMYASDDQIIIDKLADDVSIPEYELRQSEIIKITTTMHDKMYRNRAVVWGTGDPVTSSWIFSDVQRHTFIDYDNNDVRSVCIANSNIYSNDIATAIANYALDNLSDPNFEKTIEFIGYNGVLLGHAVRVKSDIFRGIGVVTSMSIHSGSDGIVTVVVLDERCPRLFAFFDFGGYVYVGTSGMGVWRKPVLYNLSGWEEYNGEQTVNDDVIDIDVAQGTVAAVNYSGIGFIASDEYSGGNNIPYYSISGVSPSGLVGKIRATSINKVNGDIKFVFDTSPRQNWHSYVELYSGWMGWTPEPSGVFASGVPFSGYSGYFSDAYLLNIKSQYLDTTNSGLLNTVPIIFSGLSNSVEVIDVEALPDRDIVSVFASYDPVMFIEMLSPSFVPNASGVRFMSNLYGYNLKRGTYELTIPVYTSGYVEDVPHTVGGLVGNIFYQRKNRFILIQNNIPLGLGGISFSGYSGDYGQSDTVSYAEQNYSIIMPTASGMAYTARGDGFFVDTFFDVAADVPNSHALIGNGLMLVFDFTLSGFSHLLSKDILLNNYTRESITSEEWFSHPFLCHDSSYRLVSKIYDTQHNNNLILVLATITTSGDVTFDAMTPSFAPQTPIWIGGQNGANVYINKLVDNRLFIDVANVDIGQLWSFQAAPGTGISSTNYIKDDIHVLNYYDGFQLIGSTWEVAADSNYRFWKVAAINSNQAGRGGELNINTEGRYWWQFTIESYKRQLTPKYGVVISEFIDKNGVFGYNINFGAFGDYWTTDSGWVNNINSVYPILDFNASEYAIIPDFTNNKLYISFFPFRDKQEIPLPPGKLISVFLNPLKTKTVGFLAVSLPDNKIIDSSYAPIRLTASQGDLLVNSGLQVNTMRSFQGMPSGIFVQQNPYSFTPVSGISPFSTLLDLSYTTFGDELVGRKIVFATSSGVATIDAAIFGSPAIIDGQIYTYSGVPTHIDTSNRSYPNQHIFLSTTYSGNTLFFQRPNYSKDFIDCTYSGLRNTEINIIRVEDRV